MLSVRNTTKDISATADRVGILHIVVSIFHIVVSILYSIFYIVNISAGRIRIVSRVRKGRIASGRGGIDAFPSPRRTMSSPARNPTGAFPG